MGVATGFPNFQNGLWSATVGERRLLKWYYEADPCRDLGAVLTITGSAMDAQAVTCTQYMQQTWSSGGISTLRAVERALAKAKAISSPSPYKCEIHTPRGNLLKHTLD